MSESASLSCGFQCNGSELLFCGVYIIDGDLTNTLSQGDHPLPIVASINDLSKIGKNDTIDYIVVYPGFKVEIYNDINYGSYSKTIDNTSNNYISIRRMTNANAAGSLKVFYRSTEIILNKISNDTEATIS